MFSESVYSPSRKPVSSRRNDLIAVCWSQTNQSIDMCTLSLRCEDGQSLHKFLHFHHSQTSPYTIGLQNRNPLCIRHVCLGAVISSLNQRFVCPEFAFSENSVVVVFWEGLLYETEVMRHTV